jgi:hypothetical protein
MPVRRALRPEKQPVPALARKNGQSRVKSQTHQFPKHLALVDGTNESRATLQGSKGLCRRHAAVAIRLGCPGADEVRQQTRRALPDLMRHLAEVIRKEEYRFRHEPRTDQERAATEHREGPASVRRSRTISQRSSARLSPSLMPD